jgi:hypothetical protein
MLLELISPRSIVLAACVLSVACGRPRQQSVEAIGAPWISCPLIVNEKASLYVTHGASTLGTITVWNCAEDTKSNVLVSRYWSSGQSNGSYLKPGEHVDIQDQSQEYGVLYSVAATETIVTHGIVRFRRTRR